MPSNALSTPAEHCTSFDPDTRMVTTSGYSYTVDEWADMLDNNLDGVGISEGEEYDAGKYRPIGDARLRGLTAAEKRARELLRRAVAEHTEQLWHPDVLAAWDAQYKAILAADEQWYEQQAALEAHIAEVGRADAAELQQLDTLADEFPQTGEKENPMTTATTFTTVRLFHNVAVERGVPVRLLAGYQPDHAVVEVFAYTVPAVSRGGVEALARRAFALANGQPEQGDEVLSTRYDERRLRSLATGDLVLINDTWLCCMDCGWTQLDTIPLYRTAAGPGTVPRQAG